MQQLQDFFCSMLFRLLSFNILIVNWLMINTLNIIARFMNLSRGFSHIPHQEDKKFPNAGDSKFLRKIHRKIAAKS